MKKQITAAETIISIAQNPGDVASDYRRSIDLCGIARQGGEAGTIDDHDEALAAQMDEAMDKIKAAYQQR